MASQLRTPFTLVWLLKLTAVQYSINLLQSSFQGRSASDGLPRIVNIPGVADPPQMCEFQMLKLKSLFHSILKAKNITPFLYSSRCKVNYI